MTALRSVALGALLLGVCAAQAEVSPHFNPATMMLSSEVQRGMKGVGKSVFHGVDITEFNVEILSVVERWNDGKDFIVARILDGPVVERKSGVMGGMSGSPVYINGKLIGAISSTFLYEREPVCGITPIEAMLECLDQPAKQAELSAYSLQRERYVAKRGEFLLGGRRISEVRIVPHSEAVAGFADDHTALMARVAPPVYCAGLPEPAMNLLRQKLEPYGIEAVPGPGHMRNPVDTELVPGAAFGVPLMWGDFDVSTGGTITYREGNLVLGFGHPFLLAGQVDIPLTTAWVHDFVPRYIRTDKMQSCMKEVGALRQDRPWAVGGTLGPMAGRVPMNLTITDETRQLTRTFHVEALRLREMTPNLLMGAALSAIGVTYHDPGTGILRVKMRVKGSAGHEIRREDTYYHTGEYQQAAVEDLSQACALLTQNRWVAQDVVECDYQASLTNADRGATVEALRCDQNVAKAGEDVTLRVRIRPENADPVEKKLTLHIPVSVEKGVVRLAVGGGQEAMRLRGRLGILPPVFTNLDGVIRFYEGLERNDQILALAGVQTKDLDIEGTRLMWMPPTMKEILENPMRTGVTRGGAELVHVEDIPWVLYGGAIMSLPIEDRLGARGKPPSSSSKDSSSGDESSSEGTSLPALPRGVPASLWWAASAFCAPPVVERVAPVNGSPEGTDKPTSSKDKSAEGKPAEEPQSTEEGEPAAEDEKPANPKEGAVGRGPSFFLHTTAADFAPGKAQGVAVRSDGALQLCPPWQEVVLPDELYVTALVAGKNLAYAGTCDPGRVYKIADGKATLAFETGEFGVSSLWLGTDGTLLVGTMPRGRIFRVNPDGKGAELCKLQCPYVWDICEAGPGQWDVAGGNDACVWRVKADGTAQKLLDLRQGHAMRLLRVKDALYIGTAQRGALYRRNADGRVEALYEAEGDDITALTAGPKGTLWLATAPKGKVISLDSNGVAREQYSGGSNAVLSLAQVRGRMFAGEGTDGRVREIVKEGVNALVREDVGRQVVCLAASDSVLYAGCASPGRVLVADLAAAATGTFDSAPLDAKRVARWGRVDWQGTTPPGATVTLRLRSGNTVDPKDGSWSAWSPIVAEPGREKVDLPPGQYLQYRLELGCPAGGASPVVDWLKISYLPANQPPTVKDFKPSESVALSGKVKLEWKMEDPDKDQLLATVLVRPRGGRDFRVLKGNLTTPSYEWDTKSLDDGAYDLRVVVDDGLSNPGDARTATLDVANLVVDNTPPEVQIISGPVQQANGGWAITGFALDRTTRIANIAWHAKDDKIWHAAKLDDGIYDWRYERFVVATGPLKNSVTEIVIRARDAAGNVTDKTVTLPKKETPAKTP